MRLRDLDYFVTALYRLRLSVESVKGRLPDKRVGRALRDFDRQVPDLVDLRNIAEHFDTYDWGIGRLLRRGHLTDEAATYGYGPTDGEISYRGKRLTIRSALVAARQLHAEVMAVVADTGWEVQLDEWPRIVWPPGGS